MGSERLTGALLDRITLFGKSRPVAHLNVFQLRTPYNLHGKVLTEPGMPERLAEILLMQAPDFTVSPNNPVVEFCEEEDLAAPCPANFDVCDTQTDAARKTHRIGLVFRNALKA